LFFFLAIIIYYSKFSDLAKDSACLSPANLYALEDPYCDLSYSISPNACEGLSFSVYEVENLNKSPYFLSLFLSINYLDVSLTIPRCFITAFSDKGFELLVL
jgi:hypothetical protein